jgi:glycosyltransferase involved in cell wall biosynthesis
LANPTISVIIPTFNSGDYLGECLRSVFAQTTGDLEVLVVDDGSTDDTPRLIKGFSEPRLQYYRSPLNKGIPFARNFGLARASGEFVAFLDADDRWLPAKLERQLAVMRGEPTVGAVFCDFVRFQETGFLPNQFTFCPELASTSTRLSDDGRGRVILGDAFSAILSMGQFPTYVQATLLRRHTVGDLQFPATLRMSQDLYFLLAVFERAGVAFIPEVLLEVRRHASNISKNIHEKPFWDLKALQLLEQDVLPHHRQHVRRRIARVHASIAYQFRHSGQYGRAAEHYLKCLVLPGLRTNALAHLLALPFQTMAAKRNPGSSAGPPG